MSKFGSAHSNPNSPWTGQIFAEQKFGTGYRRIPDRNKSHYRIPLAITPRKSIGGKSYPPAFKRNWRNGTYQRQSKEVTYQGQYRDPVTGQFTNPNGHIVRHKYHRPIQPDSEAQLARRAIFSAGVIAAQALTPQQKQVYIDLTKKKKAQTWFSIFMRVYLLSN